MNKKGKKAAEIVGAALAGAAVGVAAAVLSDKRKRSAISQKARSLKEKTGEKISQLNKKTKKIKAGGQKIAKTLKKVSEKLEKM